MGGKRVTKKDITAEIPATTQSFFGQPILILIVVATMAVASLFLLLKNSARDRAPQSPVDNAAADPMKDPETAGMTEAEDLITRVKRHIVVNEAETPFVATITNIDLVKQKNPYFYKDAEQGDKVLIWSDKAVIYSPGKDRLVSVVTAGPGDGSLISGEIALEDVSVEIRNGSRVAGAASRLRTTLETAGLEVTRVGDAAGAYEGTIVIDQTGGQAPNAMAKVAELAAGVLGTLPASEAASSADILIIIGL